jgi:hypothetical protein
MKHLVAVGIFMCVLAFRTGAQDSVYNMPMDPVTGLITYQEVVEEKGTKDELFNRGSTWLRIFYANPMAVSQVRDQSTGLIRGDHNIKVYFTDEAGVKQEGGIILYTFKIEFKEGKYRYTLDNFLVKKVSKYPLEKWMNPMDPEYTPLWNSYLEQVDKFVREEWIPSLKANMVPEVKKEEAEW